MTAERLFSVVLPTRDRPDYLAAAIDSVLAQTIDDFELIVVDDGSEVPATVPADGRITLVRFGSPRGPAAARNAGLAIASGRFVAFLDDDDVFTPDRLELALTGLSRAPIAVCFGAFLGEKPNNHRVLEGWVGDTILDGTTPSLGMITLQREVALPFDERWSAVEDVEWWLRVAALAPVTTVHEVGYLIRRHDGARGSNRLEVRIIENRQFIEEHRDYLSQRPAAEAFRWKRVGLMARALGDRPTARRAFRRSLRLRPELASAWHLVKPMRPR